MSDIELRNLRAESRAAELHRRELFITNRVQRLADAEASGLFMEGIEAEKKAMFGMIDVLRAEQKKEWWRLWRGRVWRRVELLGGRALVDFLGWVGDLVGWLPEGRGGGDG
ncbi:uncharacterized protein RCC_08810 [Ramularia collo-cygni]|uniref:Uncharacterized protein n=1 Tax=Ramularia collo-cygni TaxID=112498 RepID=A0A2D3V859_9PEZI|nr:uncharacterized protein RCC_08810 [Ramularia collo-cygni]CZT23100.1 uncharacterized protein RCC_08810 [Ramularia collo-cygni]